jgi:hypothetical protein
MQIESVEILKVADGRREKQHASDSLVCPETWKSSLWAI